MTVRHGQSVYLLTIVETYLESLDLIPLFGIRLCEMKLLRQAKASFLEASSRHYARVHDRRAEMRV